jgi:hypothetical protein
MLPSAHMCKQVCDVLFRGLGDKLSSGISYSTVGCRLHATESAVGVRLEEWLKS